MSATRAPIDDARSATTAVTDVLVADVLVVGAGPAGATAAALLARSGRRVLLVDKATFPRDKCCGDGLTTLALRELETLGLRPEHVPSWTTVDAAWLRSPSGREVCLPLPAGGIFAATTPRRELDAALLQLARDAGAEIHDGHGLLALEQFDDRVEAEVDGLGRVAARFVVAADGMWSPTRKLLGLTPSGYRGEWQAFRQYVSNVTGPAATQLYVWFEPDFLPGYAWSFPLPDGRVNLGYGVLRDGTRSGKQMNADWAGLVDRPHIRTALGPDAVLDDRLAAWPIPTAIDRAVLTAGRVLFVGDAARATDIMTGEGIGQAVLSGRLAAEAMLAGGALQPVAVRTAYEKAVRHHLLADHRLSNLLHLGLARSWFARGSVRVAGKSEWTRRNIGRWMFEDVPRAILLTPRRWHRRCLHPLPPYPAE